MNKHNQPFFPPTSPPPLLDKTQTYHSQPTSHPYALAFVYCWKQNASDRQGRCILLQEHSSSTSPHTHTHIQFAGNACQLQASVPAYNAQFAKDARPDSGENLRRIRSRCGVRRRTLEGRSKSTSVKADGLAR